MPPEPVRLPRSTPWERLENEPVRAYAAFTVYRDLGPTRSYDEATRRIYPNRENADHAVVGRIIEWSQRWRWAERARLWDDELDKFNRENQMDMIRDMNRRHISEAKALQIKAMQALNALNPEDMKPQDVLKFLTEAAKLERSAAGVPEEISEVRHTGQDGGPLPGQEPKMDVAQIAAILQVLNEAGVVPDPKALPQTVIEVQGTTVEEPPQ